MDLEAAIIRRTIACAPGQLRAGVHLRGDPTGTGAGGSDETIDLEIHEELTHTDGAIGMARSFLPNSATSQFYICDGAQHGLDGNYAVFGQVIEGMDVVRAIAEVPVDENDKPLEDVVMIKVTIQEA